MSGLWECKYTLSTMLLEAVGVLLRVSKRTGTIKLSTSEGTDTYTAGGDRHRQGQQRGQHLGGQQREVSKGTGTVKDSKHVEGNTSKGTGTAKRTA